MIRTLVRAAAHPAFETKVGHPLGKLRRRKRGDSALQDSSTTLTHHCSAHLRVILDVLHNARLEHVSIGAVPLTIVFSHKLGVVPPIIALPLPTLLSVGGVVLPLSRVYLRAALCVPGIARRVEAGPTIGPQPAPVLVKIISWQIQLASRASLG